MSSFKDLRIVDNFYQTSSYFPMPTVMISTLAEDGSTSVGSYSLCFPYYIAGKGYYAMVLEARNSSNTAQHLLAGRKQLAINFMPDGRGYHKKIVAQGWPGDTPAEKMKDFGFTLEDGLCIAEDPATPRPKVISEAYQVMECTWMSDLENATEDIGRQLVYPNGVRIDQLPASRVIRVAFNGGSSYEPLIASLAIDCGVKVNILGADTRNIEGKAFGTMLLGLPENDAEAARAIEYIQGQPNVTVEEVPYHG